MYSAYAICWTLQFRKNIIEVKKNYVKVYPVYKSRADFSEEK